MKLTKLPNHVAIILDGNGRWARKRLMPRSLGHYEGGMNLVKITNYANSINLKQLTVYAFSTENWNRPKDEINYLMTEPIKLLNKNIDKIVSSNIKVLFIGRKDRIPKTLLDSFKYVEEKTNKNTGLLLNVCFDYGSHDELLNAFSKVDKFDEKSLSKHLMIKDNVDLLIRTGGEYRLSNFLLWQLAYAELYFVKKMWPSFNKRDFLKALKIYSKRKRRFGGLDKQ
ncbi:MAG: polyprenyl diphosphate synthase [Acholeplasmataceae bacterium]